MKFTDIFVRRPVLASVVSLLILVIGLNSMRLLDLREFPETENTIITVTTVYPGADSELIQAFITAPLQRAISEADGIDYLRSWSSQSMSRIEVRMELNYDPHAAISEIQAKVASQRNILPQEAEDPVIEAGDGSGSAIMWIAFFGDEETQDSKEHMAPFEIADYIHRTIQPKLQAIPGVAKADMRGDQTFAMRIWLDPIRMAALGVTAVDVHDALRQNNFLAGVGNTKGDMTAINLTATTDISSPEAFEKIVIREDEDTLVRMQDVADVTLGSADYDLTSWFNGLEAVLIGIELAPGANPLVVSEQVLEILPDIESQLPSGLNLMMVHDLSEDIETSIEEVFMTLGEAVLIVLFLIFISLGSWHAAIVPAVSVPLSIIGGAFIMLAMGFSINLLTLLAMLLAIGLVVDDAIVVVENVHRHIQEGKKPFDAAILGARELAMPIISMTTTLLAVYAPIGFMGGLVGILFSEFAFSLAGAVLISGVVALTLSPMLSAFVLRNDATPGRFEAAVERFFERLAIRYESALDKSLNNQAVVMVFSAIIIVSIYFMFVTSTSELAPSEDADFHSIYARAPHTATLDYSSAYAEQIVDTFHRTPEHMRNFIMIGGGGTPAETFGGFRMVSDKERTRTKDEVAAELQVELGKIAGMEIAVFSRPILPGAASGLPVQFVITTDQDYNQLVMLADRVLDEATQSGNFIFLRKSVEMTLPRTNVEIDRDRAGDLGINMEDIGRTLSTMLGDNNVNRFSIQGRSYEVIPQVKREYRRSHDLLDNYYVRASGGEMVPLANLVKFNQHVEPTERAQFQQLNSLIIEGAPMPGVTLGDSLNYLEQLAAEIFPREFGYDYLGESRQYIQQGSALVITFFLSLVIIYLVLAAQFESWRDPLIILISVPMSIAGALIFITLGVASLNIYTQVGLITLIGLIAKNGILIVDFANSQQLEAGLNKRDAVMKAASIRLRPILMTTVAMLMAMVPLLFASGPGSASRFQIGLVIFTGLGIGTIFTLFVVPAFYMLLAKDRREEGMFDGQPEAEGDTSPSPAE